MTTGVPSSEQPWSGPLLRLGNGQVLLGGSALLDVVRALSAAQQVARRDGISPNARWRWLQDQLLAEAASIPGATAPPGSAAVPQVADSAGLPQDLIDTKEAAQMLACKPRNVRDLHARGVLESGRLVAGRLLLERAEVAAEVHRRAEVASPQRSAEA